MLVGCVVCVIGLADEAVHGEAVGVLFVWPEFVSECRADAVGFGFAVEPLAVVTLPELVRRRDGLPADTGATVFGARIGGEVVVAQATAQLVLRGDIPVVVVVEVPAVAVHVREAVGVAQQALRSVEVALGVMVVVAVGEADVAALVAVLQAVIGAEVVEVAIHFHVDALRPGAAQAVVVGAAVEVDVTRAEVQGVALILGTKAGHAVDDDAAGAQGVHLIARLFVVIDAVAYGAETVFLYAVWHDTGD